MSAKITIEYGTQNRFSQYWDDTFCLITMDNKNSPLTEGKHEVVIVYDANDRYLDIQGVTIHAPDEVIDSLIAEGADRQMYIDEISYYDNSDKPTIVEDALNSISE